MNRAEAARAIDAFLRAIGRNPDSEPELAGTGERVAAAFLDELCAGYAVDVDALVKAETLEVEASGVVALRDLGVTTTCPHHLMPGTGTALVAFAPRGRALGVGGIARLVDAFAHRLTLQETIGEGVAGALEHGLAPRWVACRIVMTHTCMTARGERRHGAALETIAVRAGTPADRAEALAAVRDRR